jgi:hypothetical protein
MGAPQDGRAEAVFLSRIYARITKLYVCKCPVGIKIPSSRVSRIGGLAMISFICGIVITGAGGASLWMLMPRNGQPHRLATTPVLDSIIPVCIVSAFAIGVALIVAGVV